MGSFILCFWLMVMFSHVGLMISGKSGMEPLKTERKRLKLKSAGE